MSFTEYLFDPEQIKALVEEKRAGLKANRGFSDLEGFAIKVILQRLERDPRRYRDYGPYWPALKRILIARGHMADTEGWPQIEAIYRGESDVETIVMADAFRSLYLATTIVGTNQFMLDGESGEVWTLEDEDMEGRGRWTATLNHNGRFVPR